MEAKLHLVRFSKGVKDRDGGKGGGGVGWRIRAAPDLTKDPWNWYSFSSANFPT